MYKYYIYIDIDICMYILPNDITTTKITISQTNSTAPGALDWCIRILKLQCICLPIVPRCCLCSNDIDPEKATAADMKKQLNQ